MMTLFSGSPLESRHAVKPKLRWSSLVILLAGAAACAGPVTTRSGIEGPPVLAATAVTLAPVPQDAGPAALAAHTAVAEALGRRGYPVASDAAYRIEIALAERAADVDVRPVVGPVAGPVSGPALSPAKTKRLFQDCKDQTHRLTLAVIATSGSPARAGVTRAWAEEHHCKGTLAASLPALADQAVAALALGGGERISKRQGKD